MTGQQLFDALLGQTLEERRRDIAVVDETGKHFEIVSLDAHDIPNETLLIVKGEQSGPIPAEPDGAWVICTNDYPYEVCLHDEATARARADTLQQEMDAKPQSQGQRQIYVHKHKCAITKAPPAPADTTATYEVIVGNIGTVHSGNDQGVARTHYDEYVRQSLSGVGRAGNENVVMMVDGEPAEEFNPPADPEHGSV
jgi:hypothetical protein